MLDPDIFNFEPGVRDTTDTANESSADVADVDAVVVDGSSRGSRRMGRFVVGALAVTALVGLSAVTGAWAGASSFNDVPYNHLFHDEIIWASTHNVAAGYKDGSFKPTENVTRQAAVAFLDRYNAAITSHTTQIPAGVSSVHAATANCPAGKTPIAGGGRIDSGDLFMTDSHQTVTGWYVRWESDNDASIDSTGTVWVTCKPDTTPDGQG